MAAEVCNTALGAADCRSESSRAAVRRRACLSERREGESDRKKVRVKGRKGRVNGRKTVRK